MERPGEGYYYPQCGVLLDSLDATKVADVHSNAVRQFFLRHIERPAPRAHVRREDFSPD